MSKAPGGLCPRCRQMLDVTPEASIVPASGLCPDCELTPTPQETTHATEIYPDPDWYPAEAVPRV